MSSANLPPASAGAALFGRAGLTPLDDASRLALRQRTFPARSCAYVRNATVGIWFRAGREFFQQFRDGVPLWASCGPCQPIIQGRRVRAEPHESMDPPPRVPEKGFHLGDPNLPTVSSDMAADAA